MSVYPMVIGLPGGAQARVRIIHEVVTNDKGEETLTQLVQSPPVYELRDGTTVELDVQIPDDLAAAGWHWHGSTLMRGQVGGPCIAITTDLHPPPGYTSERRTCIEVARSMEAHRAAHQETMLAERVAKATKTKRPKKDAPTPAAVQMELF